MSYRKTSHLCLKAHGYSQGQDPEGDRFQPQMKQIIVTPQKSAIVNVYCQHPKCCEALFIYTLLPCKSCMRQVVLSPFWGWENLKLKAVCHTRSQITRKIWPVRSKLFPSVQAQAQSPTTTSIWKGGLTLRFEDCCGKIRHLQISDSRGL